MQKCVYLLAVILLSGCNLFTAVGIDEDDSTRDFGSDVGTDFDTSDLVDDLTIDMVEDTGSDLPSNVIPFETLLEPGRSTRDLIALWEFDGGPGEVPDKSGNSPPMNLVPTGPVSELEGRNGVLIEDDGHLSSTDATRLYAAATASNSFTIEVWMTPANTTQSGPARVATFSADSGSRNFTFGQEGTRANLRLRTDDRSLYGGRNNGTESLLAPLGEGVSQYVATYDGNVAEIWVNGEFQSSQSLPGGIGTWSPDHLFRIGDETNDERRQWQGEIYLASLYGRALSDSEIAHHFALGSQPGTTVPAGDDVDGEGCVAWPFDLFERDHFERFESLGCTEVVGSVVVDEFDELSLVDGITTIGGDLTVAGTAAPDLLPLRSLTSVGGSLTIAKNPLLANVAALGNLTTLGVSLNVTDNAMLADLGGLAAVVEIPGQLAINRNPTLTNMILGVETVGRTLTVADNDLLETLSGLDALTRVETEAVISRLPMVETLALGAVSVGTFLYIREMDGITDLSGLQDVRPHEYRIIANDSLVSLAGIAPSANTHLHIVNNEQLRTVQGLESLTEIDQIRFYGNNISTFSFPNLTQIDNLEINSEPGITSFAGAFPSLLTVGGNLEINYCDNFTSLDGGFLALTNVGAQLQLYSLDSLSSLTGAFPSMNTVGDLDIRLNGSLPQCNAEAYRDSLTIAGSPEVSDNLDDGGVSCVPLPTGPGG